MSGGTVPLRLISLILLFSLIPPARASYVALRDPLIISPKRNHV